MYTCDKCHRLHMDCKCPRRNFFRRGPPATVAEDMARKCAGCGTACKGRVGGSIEPATFRDGAWWHNGCHTYHLFRRSH